jgi:ubiquinone/menaquinone biosynthesis C-methylase UbiE
MNWWRHLPLLLAGFATMAASPRLACAQDDFASDAARLVTALKLQEGQTVADIGAGGGQLAVALAREVGPSGRVYATELAADRLQDIREASEAAGLKNVSVLEAHATRTNLPERCCDALVLRRVYHHIDDPGQMNGSLRKSLKPGGLLAIIDFNPDSAESADRSIPWQLAQAPFIMPLASASTSTAWAAGTGVAPLTGKLFAR